MDDGGSGLWGSGEPARWNAEDSHGSGLLSQWWHATELVCHYSGAVKRSWNPSTSASISATRSIGVLGNDRVARCARGRSLRPPEGDFRRSNFIVSRRERK